MKNIYRTLHILFSSLFKTFLLFFVTRRLSRLKCSGTTSFTSWKRLVWVDGCTLYLNDDQYRSCEYFYSAGVEISWSFSSIMLFGCYCSWISLAKLINLGLVFIFMYFSILFHYIWHMYHSQACKCSVLFDLEIKSIPTFT